METVTDFILGGSKITADGDCSHEIKRCLLLGRKTMTNLDSIFKRRDITLLTKVCLVKAMVFPNHHIWMWELDHKKGWAPKNWCFQTVLLEKTLENCLDWKDIKAVKPIGNQSCIVTGRTDAEAEASNIWPPDAKSQLMENTLKLGRQEEKGMTKDEMVGWHHQLNARELNKLWETVKNREAWSAAVHMVTKSWTWLNDWTGWGNIFYTFSSIT